MPTLFLLTLVLVVVLSLSLAALGDLLGFYGIVAAWLVLWVGVYLLLNYRSSRGWWWWWRKRIRV